MADRIYSFDVFDTCLVRNFSHPHDLYRLLAKRMLWRINGNQDSLDEAVRHNDAVAVLQAMRQKAREQRFIAPPVQEL